MGPLDVIRATARPIGDVGAAFYFTPATIGVAKERYGLDGFRNYFVGRGGVLGDVDADVVRSAFGYFEPGLLRHMWTTGLERIAPHSPRDVARTFIECAAEFGRRRFEGLDGLAEFVDAATRVIAAVEGPALPLFAAVRAEPVPADPPAAAMHQAMVLRELRGSVHLLAVVAVGLPTPVAHAITRPGDTEMFGYAADAAESVTDDDRARLERADELTEQLLVPAYSTLTPAQGAALVAGALAMHAAVTG